MAVDWFLVVVVVVMVVALLLANVYVLVYFQHDDDKNTAYFPKALVVFGLFFAEATVLLLPLDVANNSTAVGCSEGWNSACGNLDMALLWLVVFMAIVLFMVVLLPFAVFYYEAEEGDDNKASRQWTEALKMELALLLVAGALLAVLFLTTAQSHLPLRVLEINSESPTRGFRAYTDGTTLSRAEVTNAKRLEVQFLELTLDVSFPVYVTGLTSFLGWFAFAIFGGIGLVAMPVDLILAFLYRPKFIGADVYAHQKLCLQRRSVELLELGRTIKGAMERPGAPSPSLWERKKQRRLDAVTLNKFKQSVYVLEGDLQDLRLCHEDFRSHNPLVPLAQLVLGCVASLVSCLWLLHIGLYMLPPEPLVPLLNTYFIWFDRWFPLFGTISVGVFSSYLLACAVKGCFKFGMRCFCLALHPMKLHGTYMNSLLFNLALVLLCAIPAVQFCDQAFQDYGRLTALRTLMGTQIHYLQGMSVLWDNNVFVYLLLAVALLSALVLLLKPRDHASPTEEIRKRIERQVRESVRTAA